MCPINISKSIRSGVNLPKCGCIASVLVLCVLLWTYASIMYRFGDIEDEIIILSENATYMWPKYGNDGSLLAAACHNFVSKHCPADLEFIDGVKLLNFPLVLRGFRQHSYQIESIGRDLLKFVASHSKPDAIMLNIGGGIGYFTIILRRHRSDSTIIALNPHPTHRIIFKENIMINNVSAVGISQVNLVLGEMDGNEGTMTDLNMFSAIRVSPPGSTKQSPGAIQSFTISPKTAMVRFGPLDVLVSDAVGAEEILCRHFASIYPHIIGSTGVSNIVPRAIYIVTYTPTSHAICLAALALYGLTVIEESVTLSPQPSRLRGRFASLSFGLLAAVDLSLHVEDPLVPDRVRDLMDMQGDLRISADKYGGNRLAMHVSPYSFHNNNNYSNNSNSDHILAGSLFRHWRAGSPSRSVDIVK